MSKFILLAIVIGLFVFFIVRQNGNKAAAKINIKLGNEFLESNKKAEGVIETASDLQYKILTQGNGSEHPSALSKVKVHYHGTLLDGTVFDSSVDRGEPISFGLNQVIKGWTEGVQLMVVGDNVRFYIPSSLGYGNRPAGKIGPGALLIFDVELLAIN
ncbi:FKBP-type peptidyl-prolyl cis-trans isomerase [Colwellia psychrerythraea]|uniref:Peptidyl-prolyl cis-trans isomerase n=1 Tax=Colwellia psychrerythraea TaxID=28229 RepID=A0A099L0B9_COLPS|nr:FKBP-type peptidyl-prolyl cis-trans isomerase [Colwellia psychrerythraea]KGJ96424.1 peptidylprolyl isomerase FKBP-type [Colwellia psychrerythraea]